MNTQQDTSSVFHIEMLDEYHAGLLRLQFPQKEWLFETDDALEAFATEDDACAAQRAHRSTNGVDPVTGGNPNA